jgi:hypothetical protein
LNREHEWLEPQTAAPGLSISLSFWAGPGDEGTILKAASAWQKSSAGFAYAKSGCGNGLP